MNRLFTAILFVVVLASSVVDAKKHEKAFRHGQKVQGSSSLLYSASQFTPSDLTVSTHSNTGGCPTGCKKLNEVPSPSYDLCLFCCATGRGGGGATPDPNGPLAQNAAKITSILGDQDCSVGAVIATERATAMHAALTEYGLA